MSSLTPDSGEIARIFEVEDLFRDVKSSTSEQKIQKVLLVSETFVPKIDGASQTAYVTLRYLQSTGRQVLVIAPSNAPSRIGQTSIIRMPSIRLPMYPEFPLALPLFNALEVLDRFEPDLIHMFSPNIASLRVTMAARKRHVPLVSNYQTNTSAYLKYYGVGSLSGLVESLYRVMHNMSTVTLVPSKIMLKQLSQAGYEHLNYWPHGVDLERFNPKHRDSVWREYLMNGRDQSALLCLYVGRIAKEKSIERLLEIARLPGVALTVVGDGAARRYLEQTFSGTQTFFTGYLTGYDLSAAYASADVFAFASETEAFGLVVQEAMASGLPVVAVDSPGVSDLVEHMRNGYLCKTHTELAQFVTTLRDNRSLVQQFAVEARKSVEGNSWLKIMQQLETIYLDALHRQSRSPV